MLKNKISLVIINYKSEKALSECLFSIRKNVIFSGELEIIVVSNDTNVNLGDIVLAYPEIALIENAKNVGFAAGANAGAKLSSGDVVWFLNPDCEIQEEINLDEILNFFVNNKVGVIGSALFGFNKKIQPWIAGKEINLIRLFLNNIGLSTSKKIWQSKRMVECDWVSGASLMIRADIFNQLNGFDENFFMYFEDMDLCKRVRALGWDVCFFPKIKIFHAGGKSYSKKELQKKHFFTSQEYFFKKYQKVGLFLIRAYRKNLN